LPYDQIVHSATLADALRGERVDVVIDLVGGDLRSRSLDLLGPGGRLVLVGNASGDWSHGIESNRLWLASVTVAGFSAGAYVSTRHAELGVAVQAALKATVEGLVAPEVDVLPLEDAAMAGAARPKRPCALTPAGVWRCLVARGGGGR